jgi:hypothetical protein
MRTGRRLRVSLLVLGITISVLGLSACSSSAGGSGASGSTTSSTTRPSDPSTSVSPSSLSSFVVPTPQGFTSERTDKLGGGPTGPQGLNEASSADCDPGQVREDHWVASELRYFDDDPAYPTAYLLMCLTLLGSSADVAANQQQVVSLSEHPPIAFRSSKLPPPKFFAVSSIPGAEGVYLGKQGFIDQVFFAKGPYFVFVVGTDLTGDAAQLLATGLAKSQYGRLPS